MKDKICCSDYPNCIHTMDGKPKKELNFMTDKTEEFKNCYSCGIQTKNTYQGRPFCLSCVSGTLVTNSRPSIKSQEELNCEHKNIVSLMYAHWCKDCGALESVFSKEPGWQHSRLCKSGADWCRSCGGFSLNYGKTWQLPTRTPAHTITKEQLLAILPGTIGSLHSGSDEADVYSLGHNNG